MFHGSPLGRGHLYYRGQVEDSASAESMVHFIKDVCVVFCDQVWQWICHQTRLEDDGRVVTWDLVTKLTQEVMGKLRSVTHCQVGVSHTVR